MDAGIVLLSHLALPLDLGGRVPVLIGEADDRVTIEYPGFRMSLRSLRAFFQDWVHELHTGGATGTRKELKDGLAE
jgi:hypothetical protein